MKLMQYGRAFAAGILIVAVSTTAQAASQGTLGTTSTGSVGISASVPGRVQISGLADFAFTNQDPSTAASSAKNVCVWSNTATKGYNITATGNGASSAFTLTDGTNTVPYSVEWAGTSAQTSGTALTSGSNLTGLTSTAVNPTCSSAPTTTASLIVKLTAANLQSMVAAASYTGTLTLVVAPE
jgi:hypothetical protein